MPKPSNFWGEEVVHAGVSDPHNPMIDSKGRLWGTTTMCQSMPAWCKYPEQQVRRLLPCDQSEQPASLGLRPEDREVRADLHLLRNASPAVQRAKGDAVLQRWRRDDSVGQRQDLGRDEG